MNHLNTPGFTAEAALYRTTNHYRSAARGSFVGDAVSPQLMSVIGKQQFQEMFLDWINWLNSVGAGSGGGGGGDDPGGWGVAFGALRIGEGDAEDLACFRRCRRFANPQRRQECYENC